MKSGRPKTLAPRGGLPTLTLAILFARLSPVGNAADLSALRPHLVFEDAADGRRTIGPTRPLRSAKGNHTMAKVRTRIPRRLPDGLMRRGKTFYARFTRSNREVYKALSKDYDTALTMLRDIQARIEKREYGILDNDCPWKEIKDQFLAWVRRSLRGAHEYERDLRRFEAFREVQSVIQINEAYITSYCQWRLAQRKGKPPKPNTPDARPFITPRSVNREIGTLRNMLNKAVAWKLIASNPIGKFSPLVDEQPAKRRRALDLEEVESLFRATPEYLLPIWRCFMVTGLRRDELVELRWSDIDFEWGSIHVRAEIAKNHKAREIPLDDAILAILKDLRDAAAARQPVQGLTPELTAQQAANFSRDHVFVTKANTPWRNNLLKRFYACCKNAGIADARPRGAVDLHSLRVTFTTLSIENGASPKAVQEILGHSTLGMTMGVYARANDRAKRDAVSALPFAKSSEPERVLRLHKAIETQSRTCKKRAGAEDQPQPDAV